MYRLRPLKILVLNIGTLLTLGRSVRRGGGSNLSSRPTRTSNVTKGPCSARASRDCSSRQLEGTWDLNVTKKRKAGQVHSIIGANRTDRTHPGGLTGLRAAAQLAIRECSTDRPTRPTHRSFAQKGGARSA
jgi:hypothetical protein